MNDKQRPNQPRSIDGFTSRPISKQISKSNASGHIPVRTPQLAKKPVAIPVTASADTPKAVRPQLVRIPPRKVEVPEMNSSPVDDVVPPNEDPTPEVGAVEDTSKKPRKFKLRRKKKEPRKRSKKKIVLFSVLAVMILAIGAGAWDVWQLDHKVHKLTVGHLTASVGGTENILVAGSTNRCNLKVQNAQWGFCSDGVTGVNSDVIFVVHLDPAKRTVSVLSIPRDTFIPDARSGNQAFKVDAALYQGPTQLVTAVEEDFGIPIQHYAEVGFDGFVNIVNAVGGIKMNFPMPVYDSESYLNVKTPGCYLMNGVQALQVIRARHLQYKPATITTTNTSYWPQEQESDIARISRTHEFLRVLATTVAGTGIDNPITDQKLVDAIAPQVQVDSGLSTSEMLSLLETFHSVNAGAAPQYTLPVAVTNFGSYDYEGENMGDVVFPVQSNDQQVVDKFLGESASTDTMTGKPLPSPQSVSVDVINGSRTVGQAAQIGSGLTALGFNVTAQDKSATPVSSQAQETVVYYAGSSTEGEALAVANQLTGYVIISQNSSMVTTGSDVTVVTGSGAGVNAPATSSNTAPSTSSATPSTSSSSSTPSSALTEAQNVDDISAPSASNDTILPWDPTACSAGQQATSNPSI